MNELSASSILIFGALSLSTLVPTYLSLKVGGKSFLPFFNYGLSVWIFLVVGILFYNTRIDEFHSASFAYSLLILLANIPVFFGLAISLLVKSSFKDRRSNLMGYKNNLIPFIFFVLLAIFLGVTNYSLANGLPPLWSAIFSSGSFSSFGSSSEIYAIRTSSTYTESFGDSQIFFLSLPVLAFIACYMSYLRGEVHCKTLVILFLFMAFVSSAFMHKASLAIYVPAAFFTYIYLRNITFKLFVLFSLIVFVVLLLGFVFYYSNQNYSTLLQMLGFRVFGSYAFNTQFALEFFPDRLDYLNGWSMIKVFGFGGGGGNLPGLIMTTVYGVDSGNASLSSFGHWYANFGWSGVIVVVVLITLWLFALSVVHRYIRKNSILVVVWLYFVVSTMDFARTDFFSAIGMKDLLGFTIFIFVYFIIKGSAGRKSLSRTNC